MNHVIVVCFVVFGDKNKMIVNDRIEFKFVIDPIISYDNHNVFNYQCTYL